MESAEGGHGMIFALTLTAVLLVSTAILVPQWWAWRKQDARERRIRALRPLQNSRKRR